MYLQNLIKKRLFIKILNYYLIHFSLIKILSRSATCKLKKATLYEKQSKDKDFKPYKPAKSIF